MMKEYVHLIKEFVLLSIALILLSACGTFAVSADTVSSVEATETANARQPTVPATSTMDDGADATPLASPTTPPSPTPAPEEVELLPAPLYYLNPADSQVWRVEQDGETLTQISQEAAPVDRYDVNPVDGSLALLSDNSLILTDALGGNRRVIVDAPSEEEAGVHWYLFARLSDPVWSADGQQLAYGLNGINFYDVASDSSRVVLPNDEMPGEGEEVRRPIHVYTPRSFSPDGASLLLMIGFYQSGGASPAVLRLDSAAPLVELQGAGFPCCTFRWSQDSTAIFTANDTVGMFQPGLWRSDAATGETEVIMSSESGGEDVRVFNWPQDLDNGEVIGVFTGQGPRSAYEQGQPGSMTLVTVDVQSGTINGQLDVDWVPGEAVWLTDGPVALGVALTDRRNQPGESTMWPPAGTLYYQPLSDASAAEMSVDAPSAYREWATSGTGPGEYVELPVVARFLRWGVADG